jgi:hypothetical protein
MAGKAVLSIAPVPADSNLYYVGLQPTDFTDTNIFFVSPNLTYNPATGTLLVGSIQYRNAGLTTNGLPRSAITYVDQTYNQAVTQGRLTDVIPFSVTITPSSVNSKIVIFVNWFGEHQTSAGWDTVYGLKRNGSVIGPPLNTSNRTGGMAMAANSYYTASANDDSTPEALAFHYVDSPATTQPVTYQLTVITGTSALTLYTNRTVADAANATDYERGTSSIIAIETA